MKALIVDRYGKKNGGRIGEMPDPELRQDDVLVQIHAALANRFRQDTMREIMIRWPGTLSLPIMPTGAIPLHRDLVRTPDGYVVSPVEAHKYDRVREPQSR